jgi:hypothetical protein
MAKPPVSAGASSTSTSAPPPPSIPVPPLITSRPHAHSPSPSPYLQGVGVGAGGRGSPAMGSAAGAPVPAFPPAIPDSFLTQGVGPEIRASGRLAAGGMNLLIQMARISRDSDIQNLSGSAVYAGLMSGRRAWRQWRTGLLPVPAAGRSLIPGHNLQGEVTRK